MKIRVANMVPCTEAEGPGRRFAIWVRGCTLACPGCCNPSLFPADGPTMSIEAVVSPITRAAEALGIEGITFVGGEPLQQLSAVSAVAEAAQDIGLGVIVFTGYRWSEVTQRPGFERFWAAVDTMVDGRFEARRLEARGPGSRRVVGSTNQRLIHRTGRYRDPGLWLRAQPVELQIDAQGRLAAVGAPADVRRIEGWLGPTGRSSI